jgi:lipid II:glycine glycyltransferase (peptidoglycan interpeptide bridge formation enzyme)
VEPGTEVVRDEILRFAQNDKIKTVKAPHDMQPRETFVVDISKNEEVLLAEMKPKVRYNVRLAEKRGVRVFASDDEKYRKAFVNLVTGTADRKGIVPHPRAYYEKMLEILLDDTAALFVAEHEGDILGANLMIFHGDTATYLHGGSGYVKREYMAPFLLQWEAIREATRRGCTRYDFGGVKTGYKMQDAGCRMRESEGTERKGGGKNHASLIMHHVSGDWAGITRFKTGFSPLTEPTVFPGCYDIVLSPTRYFLYRFFSILRSWVSGVRKSF